MVICLERGADLHTAQLMPLPLTVSCSSKIQIVFTFLVPAHPGSPGQRAVKRVCVCVYVCCKPIIGYFATSFSFLCRITCTVCEDTAYCYSVLWSVCDCVTVCWT